MGYYTKFKLRWKADEADNCKPSCEHPEAIGNKYCPACGTMVGTVAITEKVSEYLTAHKDDFYAIDAFGNCTDTAKWYEHEEQMRGLSKAFPSVLFTLN